MSGKVEALRATVINGSAFLFAVPARTASGRHDAPSARSAGVCAGAGRGSGEIDREAFQILQRYDLKSALMGRSKHNPGRHSRLESLLPPSSA